MGRGRLVVTFALLAVVLPARTAAATPPFASSVHPVTAADLGASYRAGCPVGPAELNALRLSYWGYDGRRHLGTIVVNNAVVPAVRQIFRRLYARRFPIRRMEPVAAFEGDDNRSMAADNTSAFNCRYAVAAGPKRWSVHAYGEAIDVDPLENPYLLGGTVYPAAGRPFLDRSDARPGMAEPDGVLVAAFAASGWQWGGRWTASPDFQHFSSNGG
jgi:D-alanyl-D-alanine carboxypeptidase-like protein